MSVMEDQETIVEFGVVQRIAGERPKLMPMTTTHEHDARAYMAWLQDRDREIGEKAATDPKPGEPGFVSNENSFLWNRGHENRALKDASYYVVRRTVTLWERADA